jgi:octaprenyl-diphosphate synthase
MENLPFLTIIAADLERLGGVIRDRLGSDVPLVRQVAEYIVTGGGKRLRPSLVLLSAGAAGYAGGGGGRHLEMAAVVEFIHTATLLHDDVVDASEMRRGRRTSNAEFGNAASVLVGDFLYSRAFQMMLSADSMRVMQVLADATNKIAEGEVLQLMNCHDPDVDENGYLEVIRRKTAKLFEAAARLGAVLAAAPAPVEAGLAEYGMRVGTAFQLIDDVLDYSGDAATIGKSLGDDLAEGKPTLPLIRAMACGTKAQAATVRRAIVEGGREDFAQVLDALNATDALRYARTVAEREADAARRALQTVPASAYRDSLLELASFSVVRRS